MTLARPLGCSDAGGSRSSSGGHRRMGISHSHTRSAALSLALSIWLDNVDEDSWWCIRFEPDGR
jgi:hypothetical protein